MILKSENPVFTNEMKAELKKVSDKIINNQLNVKHYQVNNVGRFYSENNISIIPLSKNIKQTILSHSKYRDLDQIKGHPSIAVSIGDLNGLDFKNIKNYINNFDDISNKLIQYYFLENQPPLQKSNIKDLFNILIYGGGFKTWIEDLKKEKPNKNKPSILINEKQPLHEDIQNFKNECKIIHELIIKNNPELYKKLYKEEKSEYKNNCSVISYWFQIIENHALFLTYNFLVKKGIFNKMECWLEYDGLCIPPSIQQYDEQELINALNAHIFKKMNIHIKYKFKEYDPQYIQKDIIQKMETDDDDDDDDDENDDDEDNFYEKLKKDEDYLNLIPIKTLMLGIDDDEKNKEKIIEEHRINCMKHFEIIMNSPNEINIVNLLKLLFGNIAVCVNIKPLSWYFYENQLWNDDKKESYRNLIDEELHPIFVNYTKLLSKLKQNYTDNNDETLEILKKLLLRSNQIADRLMTTTNRNNYCVELRSKCFKIDFCKDMNKAKNQLPLKKWSVVGYENSTNKTKKY